MKDYKRMYELEKFIHSGCNLDSLNIDDSRYVKEALKMPILDVYNDIVSIDDIDVGKLSNKYGVSYNEIMKRINNIKNIIKEIKKDICIEYLNDTKNLFICKDSKVSVKSIRKFLIK